MNELFSIPMSWSAVSADEILDDLWKSLGKIADVQITNAIKDGEKKDPALHDSFRDGWNAAVRKIHEAPATFLPNITRVIFHAPATVVFWDDGTKTVVKCQPGDTFSAETGLTTAMLKKFMGNDNTFNRVIRKWLIRTGNYEKPALPARTDTEAATPEALCESSTATAAEVPYDIICTSGYVSIADTDPE